MEPAVVDVAQVHAHQPKAQSGVLDGCELEFHFEIHSDQHVGHIPRQNVSSPHGIGGVCPQACHDDISLGHEKAAASGGRKQLGTHLRDSNEWAGVKAAALDASSQTCTYLAH